MTSEIQSLEGPGAQGTELEKPEMETPWLEIENPWDLPNSGKIMPPKAPPGAKRLQLIELSCRPGS